MHRYSCTFSFTLLLAAGLPYYGRVTPTNLRDFSGNGPTTQSSTGIAAINTPELSYTPYTKTGSDPANITLGYIDERGFERTTLNDSSPSYAEEMDISSILLYCTPVLILLLLIPLIIFIVKRKRWKKLDKEITTVEDVKSPIFEEDTPSVMEIEMEELDKWMSNMKKNGNRLSTLEEENKIHMSQSDEES